MTTANQQFELILKPKAEWFLPTCKLLKSKQINTLPRSPPPLKPMMILQKQKKKWRSLKALRKIRDAIKQTQTGEIAELVLTAEQIAERFRQERLTRDKLVKSKETEIKTDCR